MREQRADQRRAERARKGGRRPGVVERIGEPGQGGGQQAQDIGRDQREGVADEPGDPADMRRRLRSGLGEHRRTE